jgi:hypothetical protein
LHAWQKINAALGKDTWVTKIVDTLRVKMIWHCHHTKID